MCNSDKQEIRKPIIHESYYLQLEEDQIDDKKPQKHTFEAKGGLYNLLWSQSPEFDIHNIVRKEKPLFRPQTSLNPAVANVRVQP